MGGMIVCDKVYLSVVSTSTFLFCGRVNFPCLMKFPGREFTTIEFLLEDLSLRR